MGPDGEGVCASFFAATVTKKNEEWEDFEDTERTAWARWAREVETRYPEGATGAGSVREKDRGVWKTVAGS